LIVYEHQKKRCTSLRGGYLTKVIIWEAKLSGADIRGAIFNEEQVNYLNRKYNLRGSKVYVDRNVEIVSYEKYRQRNNLYF